MHSPFKLFAKPPRFVSRPGLSLILINIALFFNFTSCSQTPNSQQEDFTVKTQTSNIVSTANGQVTGAGTDSENILVYKGIPYAKPPVGELRWRPPAPPENWSEIRASDTFGRPCWQPHSKNAFVWSRGIFERSEDCLYLNIWANQAITKPKPVMVWFHGGGHTTGWGHGEIFDGTRLADLDVVVVTINYRLGPWGFLSHPLLSEESPQGSSGNYGLLDKIAALTWVQDNIKNFGGDAKNVTIFGQSAGAMSVCALMASPLSRNLFHKAIGQSASCLGDFTEDANGFVRGQALIQDTRAKNLRELRALSNQQLLHSVKESKWAQQTKITIDGWVLTEPPIDTFAKGEQAQVPLMVGSLANEGNQLFPINTNLSVASLDRMLEKMFGADSARELKTLYDKEFKESPGLALREIYTDQFMAYSMRLWARLNANTDKPAFLYFMTHVPPAFQIYLAQSPELNLPGGPRSGGAYHSGDLAFVFNNVGRVGMYWESVDYELASIISKYWANFAKTGSPNNSDLPHWPPYNTSANKTQILDLPITSKDGIRTKKLDLIGKAKPSR